MLPSGFARAKRDEQEGVEKLGMKLTVASQLVSEIEI